MSGRFSTLERSRLGAPGARLCVLGCVQLPFALDLASNTGRCDTFAAIRPLSEGDSLLVHHKRHLFDALDLINVEDALAVGMSPEEFDRITLLSNWASSFLCQSHADLGRVGPVCPFAKSAIDHRLFLLGEINLSFDHVTEFAQEIQFYKEWFLSLQGALSPDRQACMVLSLPGCDLDSTEQIDLLQRELKDEFIAEQLMIGQFHPNHQESGLWNSDFRPLVAPIPALAIRRLVPSDLPFLVGKPSWVLKYLEVFAPVIPRHTANYLSELIVGNKLNQ